MTRMIRALIIIACFPFLGFAQAPVMLPNGWKLTPAGTSLPLGDLPLNIAVSSDQRLAAVTNNGQSKQSIQLIDPVNQTLLDEQTIGKGWLGLAFSRDSKWLYASGGNDNCILRYAIVARKLQLRDTFFLGKPWPVKISPAGIALDEKHRILLAVTKEDNALYCFDMASWRLVKKIPLGSEAYACVLAPDNNTAYISGWGSRKIFIVNTQTLQVTGSIAVGDHPNDMAINKKGTTLYVANANDNSVSVVDVKKRKEIEVLNAALFPNAPSGSTTNSVALSSDGKTLFVANADNNCLSVFDVSEKGGARSKGFIPVGWYPTCVRTAGLNILVANGKGFTSLANPNGPNPTAKAQTVALQKGDAKKPAVVQYIGGLFTGTLSFIPMPDAKQLASFSVQVYSNSAYSGIEKSEAAQRDAGNPIPVKSGQASLIKYVFYVIKENRTYDQVLGDMKNGNGDSTLTLFGAANTPNQHAIASQYVLFDNFYVNGEVSADGHNWTMGGYATDYLEKTWPTSYGGRGGDYDGEGNRRIANNKNGFIWDFCKRAGVSFRTYGEFADEQKPNIPVLAGHVATGYRGWDMHTRDTSRFYQWRRDFDSLLATNAVPQFSSIRFGNDHTEGLSLGRPTPQAHVADNDLAVGLLIEHLSKSRIWNESAVFIVEDDAQNGPDHVDAHRSCLYVAGGRVRQNFADHTMYSTTSVLHTIELILGLPPMSQYDAAAEPLWRSFQQESGWGTFTASIPAVNLSEKNTAMNEWQRKSEKFNFRKEDSIPDDQFNEVIWYAMKGTADCPAPRNAAFLKVTKGKDDDDD